MLAARKKHSFDDGGGEWEVDVGKWTEEWEEGWGEVVEFNSTPTMDTPVPFDNAEHFERAVELSRHFVRFCWSR